MISFAKLGSRELRLGRDSVVLISPASLIPDSSITQQLGRIRLIPTTGQALLGELLRHLLGRPVNKVSMSKRKLDLEPKELTSRIDGATVHGLLTSMSPVKKSRKNEKNTYFTARLSDGEKSVRLISFDSKLHPTMEQFLKDEKPLKITNCNVREENMGNAFEIIASPHKTTIERSDRKYEVPAGSINTTGTEQTLPVTIAGVQDVQLHQKVQVNGKVVSIEPVVEVQKRGTSKSLRKQDCTIADSSGNTRLVLWEDDIGRVEKGVSYMFDGVTVRSFQSVNYLTVSSASHAILLL